MFKFGFQRVACHPLQFVCSQFVDYGTNQSKTKDCLFAYLRHFVLSLIPFCATKNQISFEAPQSD